MERSTIVDFFTTLGYSETPTVYVKEVALSKPINPKQQTDFPILRCKLPLDNHMNISVEGLGLGYYPKPHEPIFSGKDSILREEIIRIKAAAIQSEDLENEDRSVLLARLTRLLLFDDTDSHKPTLGFFRYPTAQLLQRHISKLKDRKVRHGKYIRARENWRADLGDMICFLKAWDL